MVCLILSIKQDKITKEADKSMEHKSKTVVTLITRLSSVCRAALIGWRWLKSEISMRPLKGFLHGWPSGRNRELLTALKEKRKAFYPEKVE